MFCYRFSLLGVFFFFLLGYRIKETTTYKFIATISLENKPLVKIIRDLSGIFSISSILRMLIPVPKISVKIFKGFKEISKVLSTSEKLMFQIFSTIVKSFLITLFDKYLKVSQTFSMIFETFSPANANFVF